MTSPNDSSVLQGKVVYTPDGSTTGFWGKAGSILGGLAYYAGEALPYIAQAASAYGNAMSASSSSLGIASDNSTPLIYQPSNVNLPGAAPISITPVSINPPKPQAPVRLQALQNLTQQLNAGINPVRETRINLLNALTQGAGYPAHSQSFATNAQVSSIHASQGSLLPPQNQNARSQTSHWIQGQPYSLQGAQRPVSYASLYQVPSNTVFPNFLPIFHRNALQTSQQKAEMNTQSAKSQQSAQSNNSSNTVYDFITNPYRGSLDPSKLIEGKEINLADLKQLFHTYDLQYYGAKTALERLQVTQAVEQLKQKLAANMAYGPDRLVTEDGYVVIGDEAFNAKTAYAEVLDYLNYAQKHDELRPPKFPTDPNKLDPKKHDVTDKVNSLLISILGEISHSPKYPTDIIPQMLKKFPNNGKWDTQGQYNLPGQTVVRDTHGNIVFKKNGYPETKDQVAYFRRNKSFQKVEAGYISNYIYGYTTAAIWIPSGGAQLIAQGLGAKGKLAKGELKSLKDLPTLLDGKDDQQAIKDGSDDFDKDFKEWRSQLE